MFKLDICIFKNCPTKIKEKRKADVTCEQTLKCYTGRTRLNRNIKITVLLLHSLLISIFTCNCIRLRTCTVNVSVSVSGTFDLFDGHFHGQKNECANPFAHQSVYHNMLNTVTVTLHVNRPKSISRMISIFLNVSLNTVSQSHEERIGALRPGTSFSVHATLRRLVHTRR